MLITRKRIILAFSFLIGMSISAQILEPAKWSCNVSIEHPKQGEIIELIFNVKLDDSWHLYSNIQNYDIGPLATEFNFEPNNTFKLISNVIPINYITKYDDVFEVTVNFFEQKAEFRQKVKILSNNPIIKASYSYQVCSTVDGKCIFGEYDFEFKITTKTNQ